MNFIRYGLIAAIAAVSIMLIHQWTQFKDEKHAQVAVERSNQTIVDTPTYNVPEATESSHNGDVPVDRGDQQAVTLPAKLEQSRYTKVNTDVFNVVIDQHGGDIVSVSLIGHKETQGKDGKPFVLLERTAQRTYVAQSGLIGLDGTDTANGRPMFNSAKSTYSLADKDTLHVDLTYTQQGVKITKRFTFNRNQYTIGVDYLINNQSSQEWKATLYAQLKRDNSEDPGANSSGMGMKPFLGVATRTNEDKYLKFTFKKLREEEFSAKVDNGWIAIVQHYFISAWVPPKDGAFYYSTYVTKNNMNIIRFKGESATVAPGQQGKISASFYAGPKDQDTLGALAPGLDLTVDYGWLWMVAQPLFKVLVWIHNIVGNWGWSIIFLTVLIKALFFKLSAASYKSMGRMRKFSPKMQQIKEQYGDDRQKQSQAMMELYKKEKINPLGGCLPILIQMPVFISLYWVLMESVELRHAPWMFWIQDLSAMDPYYILPVLMVGTMWFQQTLNPPPPDPTQAKIMKMMPFMFGIFFLWFPAGLVLYWVVNNTLSIAQQWYITKKIESGEIT
ncbi:YidC/Oxa1 family membrane protein insertase [Sinobacterium caligoides]|uniref:Membrane protein insertase YidC n=1 Tax=Sinobacterium caligoides TaxID=933926 RepID=A0A3N2DH11_9GAMM|nr:membrane protein insertase YidC [Sinobacterium caligoides]ROR99031.1 YidC/Oxa1 family membrane protein insertase [Sinobacterium caligoides]